MRIAMVAALVVIASCGDGAGGDTGGAYSCVAAFPGADGGAGMPALCIDVSGGTAQDVANNRQQCMAQGNMFAEQPCPRAGAVGGCRQTVAGSSATATTWYYANGGTTAADIRTICEGLAGVAPGLIMVEFVLP